MIGSDNWQAIIEECEEKEEACMEGWEEDLAEEEAPLIIPSYGPIKFNIDPLAIALGVLTFGFIAAMIFAFGQSVKG